MPPAITQFDIVPLLRVASPSWQPPAEDPTYVQLGSYGEFILDEFDAGRGDQLSEAFVAIERLHTDGDEWVLEAATIGILESMQNIALHRTLDLNRITTRLGPESLRWWHKLNDFWAGRRPTVA